MGENSRFNENTLDQFFNEKLKWVKLSHNDGIEVSNKNFLATYELIPNKELEFNASHYEAFYWSSFSSFKRALELDTELLKSNKIHSCGPGHTYDQLKKLNVEALIYPTLEDFLKDFCA
jgi:hypothetical protein